MLIRSNVVSRAGALRGSTVEVSLVKKQLASALSIAFADADATAWACSDDVRLAHAPMCDHLSRSV